MEVKALKTAPGFPLMAVSDEPIAMEPCCGVAPVDRAAATVFECTGLVCRMGKIANIMYCWY